MALSIHNLTKRYGTRVALDDISFEVPEGQIVGLLGPNGAGKTTLMRTVFGVLPPDSGQITWNGQPVDRDRRSGWGYMPQERGLYVEMIVIDHLVWMGELYGLDRGTARANAESLLERLGIADRANEPIKSLSGGMQQRVQLANALVHRPSLLVLDEPFAGLDPTAVAFLSDVMFQHVADGNTLLFSSHQLDLVERICRSVILIDRGRVVLEGTVAELQAASPDRYLEVDADLSTFATESGVVASATPAVSRLRLHPGTDAAQALDEVRSQFGVNSFAVSVPNLSELFLAALPNDRDERAADSSNVPVSDDSGAEKAGHR